MGEQRGVEPQCPQLRGPYHGFVLLWDQMGQGQGCSGIRLTARNSAELQKSPRQQIPGHKDGGGRIPGQEWM